MGVVMLQFVSRFFTTHTPTGKRIEVTRERIFIIIENRILILKVEKSKKGHDGTDGRIIIECRFALLLATFNIDLFVLFFLFYSTYIDLYIKTGWCNFVYHIYSLKLDCECKFSENYSPLTVSILQKRHP